MKGNSLGLIRLVIISYCCILCSCARDYKNNILNDVESFIQERPDSALAILSSFDEHEITSPAQRAKFSMLYAMALDKNYIDTTDVQIIQPAIDYYCKKKGDYDYKLKALFYQGIAYYNRGEFEKAIVSFSQAEEIVSFTSDLLYVGLLYSRISDVNNRVHNAQDEYKYICFAEDAFMKTGAKRYYYSTYSRKGQALMNLQKYNEAEKVYTTLLNDPFTPKEILRDTKEDFALLLLSKPNREPQNALSLFEDVLADSNGLRNINLWAAYAFSLSACDRISESDSIFSQLYSTSSDSSIIDIWKSATYENAGKYHEAYTLLRESLTYQDSLLNISLSQATSRAQRDYLALKNSQIQLADKNHQLRLYTAIVILATFLLILYFIFYKRNEKFKRERLEMIDIAETMRMRLKESEEGRFLEKINLEDAVSSKDSEINTLKEKIAEREKVLTQLRSEYAHMYKTQFKYLGNLCETYLLANEKKDSQRIVYEKVQDMIKNIGNDKGGQRRFEKMIDKSLDNLMRHFRDEFPKYSEEEYRFISYVFVGFDATTLCIIFNMPSVAAVYMKKSRIKKTISDSNAKYRLNYLEMFK